MLQKSAAIRVLILDDNPGDRVLIRTMLHESSPTKFQTEEAWNLEDGLDRLKAGAPDILMLDLNLPDSRGAATLNKVREINSVVPIIVVTGIEDAETTAEVLGRGAQEYLVKGRFSAALLASTIDRCLSPRRN